MTSVDGRSPGGRQLHGMDLGVGRMHAVQCNACHDIDTMPGDYRVMHCTAMPVQTHHDGSSGCAFFASPALAYVRATCLFAHGGQVEFFHGARKAFECFFVFSSRRADAQPLGLGAWS